MVSLLQAPFEVQPFERVTAELDAEAEAKAEDAFEDVEVVVVTADFW